ncbi:MAG: FtsX-like permease family protein, partial [Bradyrhizobium sp.]|nr:FtsX-like permease family protein [Bradyrhizobium sp.]
AGTERSWRKEFSLRTKWVIAGQCRHLLREYLPRSAAGLPFSTTADKDKFTNLLKDLKGNKARRTCRRGGSRKLTGAHTADFNDGLERLFPASQVPSFQRAWTHQLLESAERDLAQLSLLERASTGIYPKLETSANLKRLRINLDSKPQAAFKPTFALKVPRSALAIRGASAVTLISAILVLGGALAAGHRHRVYDAVILKTLGATRLRLLGAYALEYLMIGFATAAFSVIAGSVAAWLIVTRLMTLSFAWQAGSAAMVVLAALVVTVGLGLAGTLLALNQKPASVLRNL